MDRERERTDTYCIACNSSTDDVLARCKQVDDSAEVGVGLSCVGDRACADGNGGFDACGATQACVGVLVTSGGLTVCHILEFCP